jgi:hypothetical protein
MVVLAQEMLRIPERSCVRGDPGIWHAAAPDGRAFGGGLLRVGARGVAGGGVGFLVAGAGLVACRDAGLKQRPTSGHQDTLHLVAARRDLCAPWVRISRSRDGAGVG